MRKQILYLLCAISMFLSCRDSDREGVQKTFNIDIGNMNGKNIEVCVPISKENYDSAFQRKIKIIENSISDTIILGFGVVPPNYIGTFYYSKHKDEEGKSVALYEAEQNPPIKEICYSKYKNNADGKLVIEFVYNPNE